MGEKVDSNSPADLYVETFIHGIKAWKLVAPNNRDSYSPNWYMSKTIIPNCDNCGFQFTTTLRDSDGNSADEHIDLSARRNITADSFYIHPVNPLKDDDDTCLFTDADTGVTMEKEWYRSNGKEYCVLPTKWAFGDGIDRHQGYIVFELWLER